MMPTALLEDNHLSYFFIAHCFLLSEVSTL